MSSPAFDINARLSDIVETTLREGPQVVTKDGVETAVLVPIDQWKRLKDSAPNTVNGVSPVSIKDVLLDPNGPHDIYIPPRGRYSRRTPVELE